MPPRRRCSRAAEVLAPHQFHEQPDGGPGGGVPGTGGDEVHGGLPPVDEKAGKAVVRGNGMSRPVDAAPDGWVTPVARQLLVENARTGRLRVRVRARRGWCRRGPWG